MVLVTGSPFVDRPLLNQYADFLLAGGSSSTAWDVWRSIAGEEPGGNLIFNADFRNSPAGGPFDWFFHDGTDARISVEDAEPGTKGKVLRIRFSGQSNISFQHVTHLVFTRAGTLKLSGWLKTGGLTTDQGVFLRISDRENPARFHFETAPVLEKCDWTPIRALLTLPPATHLLLLEIVRKPSMKLDNKIAGDVWFRDLALGV